MINPSFFFGKFPNNSILTNLFPHFQLLKEHNLDAFTIALKYINGRFNSDIKR